MRRKQKLKRRFERRRNARVKSVVCSSLSVGAVGDVRSTSGHDEGSASKLAGAGCSELWRVHKDRRNLSNVVLV